MEGEGFRIVPRVARVSTGVVAPLGWKHVFAPAEHGPYTCPCCGHLTLAGRGSFEFCPECWWEDDGQDDHDSSVVRGGPNGGESLDDARARYVEMGGVPGQHVPPAEPV
ncbi:CPCC family cysteine-rich protein [Lentzea sp. NPDC003310]|uniref:CPCC family cysteine-rich protein n=1 Tax=Lentzea sp. NPDC003310 TaxID=3154447 RepID=UPI0033B9D73D